MTGPKRVLLGIIIGQKVYKCNGKGQIILPKKNPRQFVEIGSALLKLSEPISGVHPNEVPDVNLYQEDFLSFEGCCESIQQQPNQ
ncbi:hypothetical protein TVAG_475790 [Trichomonas vaginalis G3]|uniref:Uncharacterized protein n=1 Tax=Trichomonas vaginalis (strain ATCC PRA-98 / G3) TaxID=412133 RepID=A2DA03_TRIV3|nr:hypothetical protein TVAGG3_0265770 [Trichomonas vaginalis G3]EAY22651.1 hypothetical protein TVAG_475790 [Trichomonas vaginalis G3]KAI5525465.1 hypothetical protein TVAGG3_0265770 [Trichomonas vaginalis G3]|eukprot:XP_001583637.1 hypothetical protein [Trichomonas vaginalis G3]